MAPELRGVTHVSRTRVTMCPGWSVPKRGAWRVPLLPVVGRHIATRPPSRSPCLRRDSEGFDAGTGVVHVWLVDPALQTLETLRLESASYRLLGTWCGEARVRVEPFDAIELELAALWAT